MYIKVDESKAAFEAVIFKVNISLHGKHEILDSMVFEYCKFRALLLL